MSDEQQEVHSEEPISPKLAEGAHHSLELVQPTQEEIDRVFVEEWVPLLTEGGRLSLEKLKRELYDLHFLCENARVVYRTVTDGLTDNLTASAEGILEAAKALERKRSRDLHKKIGRLEQELAEARRRLELARRFELPPLNLEE
jgi:hypothetical protein